MQNENILKIEEVYKIMYDRFNEDFRAIESYYMSDMIDQDMGYIYFIENKYNGYIKIGFTKDIKTRLSTLKNQCLQYMGEDCLTLIKLYPCVVSKLNKVEKLLHNDFKQYRVVGEWFNLDKNIIDKRLCSYYGCHMFKKDDIDVFVGDIEFIEFEHNLKSIPKLYFDSYRVEPWFKCMGTDTSDFEKVLNKYNEYFNLGISHTSDDLLHRKFDMYK